MSQREVVPLTGLSQRKQAFMNAVEKSKKVERTKVPVFRVEDGLMEDSMGGSSAFGFDHEEPKGDDHQESQSESHSNASALRPSGFVTLPDSDTEDEDVTNDYATTARNAAEILQDLGLDPEKTQEVLKQEEMSAKARFAALIAKFEPAVEPEEAVNAISIQSFDVVQKRYMEAVDMLRPAPYMPSRYEGPAKTALSNLKEDYKQEVDKREQFGDLQDRWCDYDGAAEDNRWYEWSVTAQDLPDLPDRKATESENEFEVVNEKEEEITSQWIDFTEKVVETAEKLKATSDDELSIDSDMEKWREEAKRLKADAAVRKKRKEAMLEHRKKRQEVAVKRHEEYVFKKGGHTAEVGSRAAEGGSRAREQDNKDTQTTNSRAREEEAEKQRLQRLDSSNHKNNDEDSTIDDESSNDSDGDNDIDNDTAKSPKPPKNKKKSPSPETSPKKTKKTKSRRKLMAKEEDNIKDDDDDDDDDEDDDEDETKNGGTDKKKKKSKKDKEKKEGKSKKKKEKTSGNASSSKLNISSTNIPINDDGGDSGPPAGDDDEMMDGPEEKNPRHLDGSLWKNPLKFWTNKPKKVNETGAKVILKTIPRSDCFRRTEKTGSDNASFYWFKAEGDFDIIVKIKGNFRSSYDKAGIMLREDDKNWCLSGVEFFNGELNHSTCITRGISDWSLSPLPAGAKDGVWICVKRVEGKVECYFSMDVRKWVQTRQGFFSTAYTLKVGIAAACPMGEPFKVVFERFKIKPKA